MRSEDTWALVMGLGLVLLGMAATFGIDLLSWAVVVKVWTDPAQAFSPTDLALTTLALVAMFTIAAATLDAPPQRFAPAFTVVFLLTFVCWFLGHNAFIAATPDQRPPGVSWSLGLTGEAGYLVALLAGLAIANFVPPLARWLQVAARPEWFIKVAIIVYGAGLGLKAASGATEVPAILFRGLAAIIEAYLIYWALVYLVARRWFGFSREWSAPLASGISICGVSAAITTGAAIRARPVVPVMVSSLVVVFAVMEMLVLPTAAKLFLSDQPLVAAAWMGLAVKTDGAALASGAVTASLIAGEDQGLYDRMVLTTTTVKVFIDLFIGVWAVVLGAVWAYGVDRVPGQGVPWKAIWLRFPKFVFGYVLAFAALFALAWWRPDWRGPLKTGTEATNAFRQLLFALTFFSMGLLSDFRKLWAEGLGRLAAVYTVCLFGFVIWIGLGISWLFFADMR
jgi:uncharacterized membrane protein YadS